MGFGEVGERGDLLTGLAQHVRHDGQHRFEHGRDDLDLGPDQGPVGRAKIVRIAAATLSVLPLGTLANTFLMKCTLCRRRHKVHYADLRIMPMWMRNPLQDSGLVLVRSA